MELKLQPKLILAYPGFKVAYTIIRNTKNAHHSPQINQLIQNLPSYVKNHEQELLLRANQMRDFYKKIGSKNRYHILSLLKSTLKGRDYKPNNPAVDLVYAVEMQTAILMGLHDLNTLEEKVDVDIAQGGEILDHIAKGSVNLDPGAILFKNGETIMASLTDGPDKQTKVTQKSTDILVMAFGSPEDTEASLLAAMEQTNAWFREYDLGEPEEIFMATA